MKTYIANSLTGSENLSESVHLCMMSEWEHLYKCAPSALFIFFTKLHFTFHSSPLSPHLSLGASVTPHRAPFSPFIILLFLPEHFQFQAPPLFPLFTFIIHRFFTQCLKRVPQTQKNPANLTGIKHRIKVSRVYLCLVQQSSFKCWNHFHIWCILNAKVMKVASEI